ncbi:gp19.5 family protein, partial [Escherichia coli]
VLAVALGASLVTQQQLSGLETLVCSLLTCSD